MSEIRIRASSLPTFESCSRLWAARHASALGIATGWGLEPRKQHIGAVVGTAVHRGAEHLMSEFGRTGEVGGDELVKAGREAALDSFSAALPAGISYDSGGPTFGPGDATDAISKMVPAYHASIDPDLPPILVEAGLSMTVGDDLVVTGHTDLMLVDAVPDDLKTGRHRPRAWSQYGAYFLLLRANAARLGIARIANSFRQRYLPRVARGKPQPAPDIMLLPQGPLEHQALATARQIRRSVEEFRRTGDPDAFLANPNTWLCGEKFCPAYGSRWCDAWRLKPQPEKD